MVYDLMQYDIFNCRRRVAVKFCMCWLPRGSKTLQITARRVCGPEYGIKKVDSFFFPITSPFHYFQTFSFTVL